MVDTNVAIVANGRPDPSRGARAPSVACRLACVEFLGRLLTTGQVILDVAGAIQDEYRRNLRPSGQPGVGDRFYQAVLNSAPRRVVRIELPQRADGSYEDFPDVPELAAFDPSDRKFAAAARRTGVPVSVATDSDWHGFRQSLHEHGIDVAFLCGDKVTGWFEP